MIATVGNTSVEVVAGRLVDQEVAALLLSANNRLEASPTRWSWSQEVERAAGGSYVAECRALAAAAGAEGIRQGTAVISGGATLTTGSTRRWVLQAITIAYRHGQRIPATPEIVYGAVRSALERAELFRIPSVATYLMAIRDGYAAASSDIMADALCRALVDHAAIASAVVRLVICESNVQEQRLATSALQQVLSRR